jgi:hypothetical protein
LDPCRRVHRLLPLIFGINRIMVSFSLLDVDSLASSAHRRRACPYSCRVKLTGCQTGLSYMIRALQR